MSNFDIAIGLDANALNPGIAGLYQDPNAYKAFFVGSVPGSGYTAGYTVLAAPTFNLSPDAATDALWAESYLSTGENPPTTEPSPPGPNPFVVTFPQFQASIQFTGKEPTVGTATNVLLFCSLSVSGSVLTLVPQSVYVDLSQLSGLDRGIVKHDILPKVLENMTAALAAVNIPPLTFSEDKVTVSLTPPVAGIVGGQLVVASCLTSDGTTPDISGFTWPSQDLFVLLSSNAVTQIANQAATAYKLLNSLYPNPPFTKNIGSGDIAKVTGQAELQSFAALLDPHDATKAVATVVVGLTGTIGLFGATSGPCSIGAATSNM